MPQEQSRTIKLPDGYPPGYIIDRGGAEIKRMQYRYGVRIQFDSDLRRVIVRGASSSVNETVNELMMSFEAFSIKICALMRQLMCAITNGGLLQFQRPPRVQM